MIVKSFRTLADRAGGIDHIVHHQALLTLHVADDVHDFQLIRLRSSLIDDRHGAIEFGRDRSRAGDGTHVGGNDHEIVVHLGFERFVKDGPAEQIIHGNIEKALDLRRVKVHRKNPVRTGGSNDVCHEFCRDGIARSCFSVLSRITEIGHNGGYSCGRSTLHSVDHNEHFHKVVVNRSAG